MTVATFMGVAIVLYLTQGADMMFTLASGISGGPRGRVITDGVYGVFARIMADRQHRSAQVMNKVSDVVFGGLVTRLACQ